MLITRPRTAAAWKSVRIARSLRCRRLLPRMSSGVIGSRVVGVAVALMVRSSLPSWCQGRGRDRAARARSRPDLIGYELPVAPEPPDSDVHVERLDSIWSDGRSMYPVCWTASTNPVSPM